MLSLSFSFFFFFLQSRQGFTLTEPLHHSYIIFQNCSSAFSARPWFINTLIQKSSREWSQNHVNSKGKIPSTGGSEEGRIRDSASHRRESLTLPTVLFRPLRIFQHHALLRHSYYGFSVLMEGSGSYRFDQCLTKSDWLE